MQLISIGEIESGWFKGGVLYAMYNLAIAPVLLFSIRAIKTRKEAILSSQIEGTQSSLSDLLMYEADEAPGTPIDDITEVSCYVSAMNYGLERLNKLPLSLRLLREIHEKLMQNSRGGHKSPGEFRTSQNWIGGSRPGNATFVPIPPEKLMEALSDFEKFLPADLPLPEVLSGVEEQLVKHALEDANYVQARAAESLGITKSLLQYKMKKYKLQKK